VDSVRFAVSSNVGGIISLHVVLEKNHLPAGNGTLEYDQRLDLWPLPHPDLRIQKQAQCFVKSYLERKGSTSSSHERTA
jgi:hypothetical protein